MSDSLWPHRLQPSRLLWPWDFLGKNTGVGCHFLLQGIFLTQGLNLRLLLGRQILYRWATKEASKIKCSCIINEGKSSVFPTLFLQKQLTFCIRRLYLSEINRALPTPSVQTISPSFLALCISVLYTIIDLCWEVLPMNLGDNALMLKRDLVLKKYRYCVVMINDWLLATLHQHFAENNAISSFWFSFHCWQLYLPLPHHKCRSMTSKNFLPTSCFLVLYLNISQMHPKASGSSSWAQSTCYLLLEKWEGNTKKWNL